MGILRWLGLAEPKLQPISKIDIEVERRRIMAERAMIPEDRRPMRDRNILTNDMDKPYACDVCYKPFILMIAANNCCYKRKQEADDE